MVSSNNRVESASPLGSVTQISGRSRKVTNSFSQQLATAVVGDGKQPKVGVQAGIRANLVSGQNSGGSQFLATPTARAEALGSRTRETGPASSPTKSTPPPASTSSNIPTMLGMGPTPGPRPVTPVTDPRPVAPLAPPPAPISEGDAYWAQQPAAVQVLRNMPEGEAKNKLALKLANQGYAVDTQIMVWGWDPQMTMTVRANQGYAWVPSYGQSNIPVGPGISDPYDPGTYNPAAPPAGSIKVSTAFAVGAIQNPLVQADPTRA